MVLAVDFSGLSVWADALGTILLLELCVLLLIIAALILLLALAARWVQMHMVPLLNTTVPVAKQALEVTNQSTDRVVHGVAEVYGIRSALETAARIMVFGKDGPRRPAEGQRPASVASSPPPEALAARTAATLGAATEGHVGPAERRTPPPTTDPRRPNQPYDNTAAHAS